MIKHVLSIIKKDWKIKYLIIILSFVFIFRFLWIFDPVIRIGYDLCTQQKEVDTFLIERFTVVNYSDLPDSEKIKLDENKCQGFMFEELKFIKVPWFERYKNIIGNDKIYQLLTPDRLIRNRIRMPNLSKIQYLLIDAKIIEVHRKLIIEMRRQNLNTNEIRITSAYRNPQYNRMVGGASCSQHQIGNAIDISIGDVNNDNELDNKDIKIIYSILDEKLIGDNGGLGRYKNHPKLIHFDTRGSRARW